MRQTFSHRPISTFAALSAFALFALCILCVLLSGAGVYRRLVTGGQENYAHRTAAQYLSTKVRQCPGALTVERFDQEDALVLAEEVDGEVYLTRVYCHNGWLMELFSAQSGEFAPADGEKLLPAQRLELELNDGLLEAALTDQFGETAELSFALRTGEGGTP